MDWMSFVEAVMAWPVWRWGEAVAALLGLLSIWYLRGGHIVGYPVGMISTLLYIWVCTETQLYAHTAMYVYFFGLRIYGWHYWLHDARKGKLARYGYCSRWEWGVLGIGMPICAGMMYVGLRFTDSDVALWDSLTATGAVATLWLLARKRLENWIFGFVSDLAAIPLLAQKGLWVSTIQLCVFLWLGVMGWLRWRHFMREQQVAESMVSANR